MITGYHVHHVAQLLPNRTNDILLINNSHHACFYKNRHLLTMNKYCLFWCCFSRHILRSILKPWMTTSFQFKYILIWQHQPQVKRQTWMCQLNLCQNFITKHDFLMLIGICGPGSLTFCDMQLTDTWLCICHSIILTWSKCQNTPFDIIADALGDYFDHQHSHIFKDYSSPSIQLGGVNQLLGPS